jgi:tetratricopeptide (TPR) repeat protein
VPTQILTNAKNELCDHGWLHKDRIATVDYASFRIPKPRERKATSLSLTLQTPDEYFDRGTQLLNQGHLVEAVDAFFSATQLQWTFTAAHIELGNTYSALKRYSEALEAYGNAIETDPASIIAHHNIALTFADLARHDEACAWVARTINIDPKYQLAYMLRANLLLAAAQPEKAVTQLLFAARLTKPCHPDILVQAGNVYEQINQTDRALRCYRRALKSDPWHALAFYSLGLYQYNAGQLHPAQISLAYALTTQPKYPEAQALLKKLTKELTPKKPRRPRKSAQSQLFPLEALTQ